MFKEKIKKENVVFHESAGGIILFASDFDLEVALIKKETGEWVFPKGHIEKGENSEDAAIREIGEEVGIHGTLHKITKLGIGSYSFYLEGDSRKHFKKVHVYLFIADKKEVMKPFAKEKFAEARWFNIYEAIKVINYPSALEWILRAREYYLLNRKSKGQPTNKLISFCIPVYNGERVILKTLNSLKKIMSSSLKKFDFEIIVCIDHCNDNTEMICENFKKQHLADLKIIFNDRSKSKTNCMNKLIKNANGNIIILLDDDATMDKKTFLALINSITKNNYIKIVYPDNIPIIEEIRNPIKRFWWNVFSLKFREDIYTKEDPYLIGRCMVLRKKDWFNLPENPIMADDIILQYTYHPYIKKVNQGKVYFNSVHGIKDYLQRFYRISLGKEIAFTYFSKYRKQQLHKMKREINYNKVKKLSFNKKFYFYCYRILRFYASIIYKYNKRNKRIRYEWNRIKQN